MKVKVLYYEAHKNGIVKVRSHKRSNGKWKKNKNWEWHKRIASGVYNQFYPTKWQREQEVELQ